MASANSVLDVLELSMNQFKFVRVKVAYKEGAVDASVYQSAIADHAEQGWDLVQIFVENPAAVVTEHVVIFRRAAAQ